MSKAIKMTPYDHRTAAHWDASVLGITDADFDHMNEDEKQEYLADALHRASDLATAISKAFREYFNQEQRRALLQAAKALEGLARTASL